MGADDALAGTVALVARRGDRLESLATELRLLHRVYDEPLP